MSFQNFMIMVQLVLYSKDWFPGHPFFQMYLRHPEVPRVRPSKGLLLRTNSRPETPSLEVTHLRPR